MNKRNIKRLLNGIKGIPQLFKSAYFMWFKCNDSDWDSSRFNSIKLMLVQWWYLFRPDNCSNPDCKEFGMRGNENIVDGKTYCDDCS